MKIEIYTKDNCIWSDRAKNLLNSVDLTYTEIDLSDDICVNCNGSGNSSLGHYYPAGMDNLTGNAINVAHIFRNWRPVTNVYNGNKLNLNQGV